ARVGTCAERPLQRGAELLEAGAAARHARRPQVLSPRHGGTLSRQRRCCEDVVPPRTRPEPTLLPAVGAGRGEVRGVKRLAFLTAVLAALFLPVAASAHPLGNFTVNRFSRIEVSGSRIYVRYVLDLAEIPTFQAGKIDAHAYARRIARGAHLTVNERHMRLIPIETVLAHPAGAGGLRTTRLETILRGPKLDGASDVEYRDTNYGDRIGWKEIVVGLAPSASHELRAYPQDLLSSPLAVSSVRTASSRGFSLGRVRM